MLLSGERSRTEPNFSRGSGLSLPEGRPVLWQLETESGSVRVETRQKIRTNLLAYGMHKRTLGCDL
jgi:hypothetical protein